MADQTRPVFVAFDGSPEARRAVTAAVELFPGRPLVVISVWEPGLAMVTTQGYPDVMGTTVPPPTIEEIETIDRVQQEHADGTAETGAQLARELGATAEALAVPDSVDVARTIEAEAEARGAAALVVGSRGLGAVKSRLMGSTSRSLLKESHRPVVVVPMHR